MTFLPTVKVVMTANVLLIYLLLNKCISLRQKEWNVHWPWWIG